MLLRKILFKIKKIVKGEDDKVVQAASVLIDSEGFLRQARAHMVGGDFSSALEAYLLAKEVDPKNLEAYIGIALCYINLNRRGDAFGVLQAANNDFGDHDAILGLIIKLHLHERSWEQMENYWTRWRDSLGKSKTLDFYQTTGDILVSSLKFDGLKEEFAREAMDTLICQDDESVGSKEHPVICSLLFLQHEYDRPLYKRLLEMVKVFLSEQPRSTLCTATMRVSFGLVQKEERKEILRNHFHDFGLYSHWPFVLLGSSWNAIWDDSIKSNTESIPILKEILLDMASNLDVCGAAQTYKMIFIANICARELTPTLIEHACKLLEKSTDAYGFRADLEFIAREYQKPKKELQKTKKQRLKIAFCVSGQLRGWQKAFRSWQKIGLAEHDVTYIVHTWKDTGGGYPIPPKDERAFPAGFQNKFREVWNQLGSAEMLSRYSRFFSLWPKNGADVDLDDLKQVYGSNYIYIDDDSIEPFKSFSNSEKMYYKIWECQKSADQLGGEFDLIVRIRPDLEFIEEKALDWNAIHQDCVAHNALLCESYSTYFFPNIGYCMPDQFAIASPDTMRGYASAYAMTKKYSVSNNSSLKHFPEDFVAHRNVAYSTLYNGIQVDSIGLPCRFSPAFKPTKELMAEAILHDSIGRNDDFDHILLESLKLD